MGNVEVKFCPLPDMKIRLSFYAVIAILTVFQSWLLSSPNLLGKVGLVIYHYKYLRTFPRTLLTVSIVVLLTVFLCEGIRWLDRKKMMRNWTAEIILSVLFLACTAALLKTVIDFSTWTYSHTGMRFKYGAYLLPVLLITIIAHTFFTLPKKKSKEAIEGDAITKNNPTPDADH